MVFNSLNFLAFFPIVVLLHFIIPKKIRVMWLLACSYIFYMSWNPRYVALIIFSTMVSYVGARLIDGRKSNHKKIAFIVCIIIHIFTLIIFKYTDFIVTSINAWLDIFRLQYIDKKFDIILPIGISFYTFQVLGYLIDVYRGEVVAEKNILNYALFVSFFPQLVAGPIERSKSLLTQIQEMSTEKAFEYERTINGLILMLYGLFLKMVIADRVSILADTIFDSYWQFNSLELLIGVFGFALQIYCDFAGYSVIAIGAAKILNVSLMDNFDTPYFSTSIKEFWNRWHISLSGWFRDYIYIPLGGNKCSKMRNNCNLIFTFLLSGLWHGAAWHYIVWGGIHGVYRVIENSTAFSIQRVISGGVMPRTVKYIKMAITFSLLCFGWIFFRAESTIAAFKIVQRILFCGGTTDYVGEASVVLGLERIEIFVLLSAIAVMLIFDIIKYKEGLAIDLYLKKKNIVTRWIILYCLLIYIIVFGVYGPMFDTGQFIYFQF